MKQEILDKAIRFKRKTIGTYQSITKEDISSKIAGSNLVATVKIDGEYNLFYYNKEEAVLINSNGVVKNDLPILSQIASILKAKGVESLLAAVELHVKEGRSRVSQTMSAIKTNPEALSISAFDLLEIDGEEHQEPYDKVLEKLQAFFGEYVVEAKHLQKDKLENYFEEKVVNDGHEGLVVRSNEFPIVYKLKPQHSLDLAVIGYTLEDDGIRELLVAALLEEGKFIQVSIVGNGLNEQMKKELLLKLSSAHVKSSHVEVDKRRIAFHMVKPEIVIEVSVNELTTENSQGVIKKPLVYFDCENGYIQKSLTPCVSLIHPIVKTIREDKSVNTHDVRFAQITDVVFLEEKKRQEELPKSEILARKVFTKAAKGLTNVKKFVVLKTNKEALDDSYPAYVFHFTDFSPSRKDPLKKEVRISSSLEQIENIFNAFIESEIKKGWQPASS